MKPSFPMATRKGHYFCDKCDEVALGAVHCGQPARWVPDTIPSSSIPSPRPDEVSVRSSVTDETARKFFAEMRDLVAASPDAFGPCGRPPI